jgi:hypothetical protein
MMPRRISAQYEVLLAAAYRMGRKVALRSMADAIAERDRITIKHASGSGISLAKSVKNSSFWQPRPCLSHTADTPRSKI